MTPAYYFELLGTVVFAITGVLAVTRRGLDVFGALVLGVVTALGGGTVRDLLVNVPIFWLANVNYVWAIILTVARWHGVELTRRELEGFRLGIEFAIGRSTGGNGGIHGS